MKVDHGYRTENPSRECCFAVAGARWFRRGKLERQQSKHTKSKINRKRINSRELL